MKPEFEQFRTKSSHQPASVRLPDELQRIAELIAKVEGDSLSSLLIEGLVRVIDDRRNDPSYMQDLIVSHEALLFETRAALGLSQSVDPASEV